MPDMAEDGRALFLAGLSENCEFTDLHQLFDPFGKVVLCRVLKDAKTGKSRRVGYVNFERGDDAMNAMSSMQGKPGPGGIPLDIKMAAQDPTFKAVETKKIFVRYVPVYVTSAMLRDAFAQFGEIEDCVVLRDLSRTARKEPGPWNMAYVTFKDNRDAITAVAKAASLVRFGDQELTVKPAVSEETLRLRSKFRQAAGGVPGPTQHNNGLLSGGGGGGVASNRTGMVSSAGPNSMEAPPGMIPIVIPGVGLAYMPLHAAQAYAGGAPQPQGMQQAPFVNFAPQPYGSNNSDGAAPQLQLLPVQQPPPQAQPLIFQQPSGGVQMQPIFLQPPQQHQQQQQHHQQPLSQPQQQQQMMFFSNSQAPQHHQQQQHGLQHQSPSGFMQAPPQGYVMVPVQNQNQPSPSAQHHHQQQPLVSKTQHSSLRVTPPEPNYSVFA